jgi:hypothetical protein
VTRAATKKQVEKKDAKDVKDGKEIRDKLLEKQIATAKQVEQTRELLLKMVT